MTTGAASAVERPHVRLGALGVSATTMRIVGNPSGWGPGFFGIF